MKICFARGVVWADALMQRTLRLFLLTLTLSFTLTLAPALCAFGQGGNQISGTVKILASDGSPLNDRSNVVLFVDGIASAPESGLSGDPPRISHLGKVFSPQVLPVVRGSKVDFFNDDDIFHNVFSLSAAKPFDLGIYPQGSSKIVDFDKPGLVKLYCNIHPGMVSSVLVLNNPYFAITDTKGNFLIENVPDGEFVLRSWHELSEERSFAVVLSGGQAHNQNVELTVSKRIRQHKNKFGKNYRSKY